MCDRCRSNQDFEKNFRSYQPPKKENKNNSDLFWVNGYLISLVVGLAILEVVLMTAIHVGH